MTTVVGPDVREILRSMALLLAVDVAIVVLALSVSPSPLMRNLVAVALVASVGVLGYLGSIVLRRRPLLAFDESGLEVGRRHFAWHELVLVDVTDVRAYSFGGRTISLAFSSTTRIYTVRGVASTGQSMDEIAAVLSARARHPGS